MAKKHKKRKKLSRRARRDAVEIPVKRKRTGAELAAAVQQSPAEPQPDTPPQPTQPETPATEQGRQDRTTVTAKFTPDPTPSPADSDPDTDPEYRAVRRDLRKLGVTIVTFAVLITGLVFVNDSSDVVGGLGDWLFGWWE